MAGKVTGRPLKSKRRLSPGGDVRYGLNGRLDGEGGGLRA